MQMPTFWIILFVLPFVYFMYSKQPIRNKIVRTALIESMLLLTYLYANPVAGIQPWHLVTVKAGLTVLFLLHERAAIKKVWFVIHHNSLRRAANQLSAEKNLPQWIAAIIVFEIYILSHISKFFVYIIQLAKRLFA